MSRPSFQERGRGTPAEDRWRSPERLRLAHSTRASPERVVHVFGKSITCSAGISYLFLNLFQDFSCFW